ncbi:MULTISPECIES: ParB/RepB/Spo0J family partition protein [Vibrio]|jgi:ParB family chromosome partitioning protein|uniref:Probable chromosome-partitioning protein ParB n=2 Tax=Vibrio vulnificus TaxID=672 RepID=A0A087I332_VIBVL|nr:MULTISPECIES: ParB/RepB/Spo0J family partition protein [Vibrio]EWS69812.1 chromosome partitioning protein ParB [Vibrio vulnificus BAA87]AAO09501.1 Chromosome (plasmid) partitioning protein ParB / Stage 0 sporulation protein J [Vibrio vulnificus CMCP6]ADV85026.1 chromosome (plasmid) partitioning protein ParB / Stage 0 sporulation protein J [Vibrio vulnificus MO6-24/O]AIL72049.1 parB family protein [Vibrio vulnificus]AMG13549.1 chromosome partitioning protein ParB [Vibrio vulnificus]
MSKRGLGKGLDALLSTSSLAREKQHIATQSQALSAEGELTDIAVGQLQPGVYQPRKDMSPQALEELTASIQSQGIIQPIVVRPVQDGHFEIIAGERRWRAAKLAGLKRVPCLIKHVEDRAAIAMALIENIQREDLNVIEEAQALERLQDEFSLTHQQVADVIGKSRTAVSNLLRLNGLELEVKQFVAQKLLDMGHARALLALEGEQQVEVAQQVASKALTVRQTEQLVKKCLTPKVEEKNQPKDEETQQISQKLSETLGAKVSLVRNGNGKAKLTISIDEPHKLEQLIAKLES